MSPEKRRTSTRWKSQHTRGTLAELLAAMPAVMRAAHTPQHLAVRADLLTLLLFEEAAKAPFVPAPAAMKLSGVQFITRAPNGDVTLAIRIAVGFLLGRGNPITLDRVMPAGSANVPAAQFAAWTEHLREATNRLSEGRHDQDFDFLQEHAGFADPQEADQAIEAMRRLARMSWLRLTADVRAVTVGVQRFRAENTLN